MGIIAQGWKVHLDESEGLLAAFKMRIKKFNEMLHPRGADGRFISKGASVKWLDNKSNLWNHGTVDKMVNSPNGSTIVKIKRPDGTFTSVTSDKIYTAKAPQAKIDLKGMKQIGPQAGSNPGGLYQSVDGTQHYVKTAKSEKHAINEILGTRLYAAAGVAVPDASITADKKQVASKIEESIAWSNVPIDLQDSVYAEIRKNFVIDAWLANWDAPVTDNIRVTKNGTPIRVDTGGALDYRAQGASKIENLTPEVTELKTLRDANINYSGYQLYGKTTKEEEEDGVKRILALHPDTIRDIVKTEDGPDRLADDLIARRAWLAIHYGFSLPEETSAGKTIIDQFVKTKTEDSVMPSMTSAVKKLGPNDPPSIGVGSPVWLKDKDAYGTKLPDTYTVTAKYEGTNETKYDLKSVKGNKTVLDVSEADLEVLRDNYASINSKYSDGSIPSIGDKVTLANGETGEIIEMFPMYAKVQVDAPDGSKPIKKVVATKKLTPQVEKIHDNELSDKEKFIAEMAAENSAAKAANTAKVKAHNDKYGIKPALHDGLYSKHEFKPEYAEIQQKYRKAAVAKIVDKEHKDVEELVSNLIPTQPKEISETASTGAGPKGMKPIVAQINGKKYLLDGHHRAMNSNGTLDVHFVDFDAAKNDVSGKSETGFQFDTHDWSLNPSPAVKIYNSDDSKYYDAQVDFYAQDAPYVVVKSKNGIEYVEKNNVYEVS